MYFSCIRMYWACIYKQFTNEYEHTSQYKPNTNTEFMYVLCTLNVCITYVFVCIDINYRNCFLESIILTDMHMSMNSNNLCSHHSNSAFYFLHITQPIRDDLMARPWPTCWCRRVFSRILARWLGHMCPVGSTPAACLPLKTECFQCHLRVPTAGGREYSWQAVTAAVSGTIHTRGSGSGR